MWGSAYWRLESISNYNYWQNETWYWEIHEMFPWRGQSVSQSVSLTVWLVQWGRIGACQRTAGTSSQSEHSGPALSWWSDVSRRGERISSDQAAVDSSRQRYNVVNTSEVNLTSSGRENEDLVSVSGSREMVKLGEEDTKWSYTALPTLSKPHSDSH